MSSVQGMNELPYVTDSTYLDMSVCFAEERKGKEKRSETRLRSILSQGHGGEAASTMILELLVYSCLYRSTEILEKATN